jgi:2-octaprenylphenol hydroxylase
MADTYDHYDVIIVGAGLVGLTLAAALGGTAYDVLVIDARSQPATREPPVLPVAAGNSDFVLTGGALGGVLAINPASTAILRRLDVWDRLPADAVCAYDAMHVWDGEGTGSIDFAAADIGRDALGHVVETAVLLDALEARVRGLPNVTL